MLILRALAILAGLFVFAMGVAWLVTRDRKYLVLAKRVLQAALVVGVAYGLFYVFSRVLLF